MFARQQLPNEFVYQVFSLLIAFILVHAVYVTLIRPQASAFLQQEARQMQDDPQYVQQRSFYVVIKDYEQEACFVLMFWAFAILGYKGLAAWRQHRLLAQDLLSLLDKPEFRVVGEFGVGTNPLAMPCEVTLEAEKAVGTIHLGFGDNRSFGGENAAAGHWDAVMRCSNLELDGSRLDLLP